MSCLARAQQRPAEPGGLRVGPAAGSQGATRTGLAQGRKSQATVAEELASPRATRGGAPLVTVPWQHQPAQRLAGCARPSAGLVRPVRPVRPLRFVRRRSRRRGGQQRRPQRWPQQRLTRAVPRLCGPCRACRAALAAAPAHACAGTQLGPYFGGGGRCACSRVVSLVSCRRGCMCAASAVCPVSAGLRLVGARPDRRTAPPLGGSGGCVYPRVTSLRSRRRGSTCAASAVCVSCRLGWAAPCRRSARPRAAPPPGDGGGVSPRAVLVHRAAAAARAPHRPCVSRRLGRAAP